jgi:spermidine/putrescine transport system permease protein
VSSSRATSVTFWMVMAFLYLPIVVLVVMSFNGSDSPYNLDGLSLQWYGELFDDSAVLNGLKNTLIVASATTVVATALGTTLALGLHRYTRSKTLEAASLTPAILPDVVLAIGLLAYFSLIGLPLGLHAVLLSHIVFATAFVAAVVKARLNQTDPSLDEASMDLGANRWTTFQRVTVPLLAPGIVAGALLAFTLSLDEFVIAFFTNGASTPTLPIVIYSMVRFGVTPEINALATLMVIVSFGTVIVALRLSRKVAA